MKIAIITGAGRIGGIQYGSGHFERMSELRRRLERRGDSAEIVPPGAAPIPADLYVVDARDLDPGPFRATGRPVLALDNRHESRPHHDPHADGVIFYDTIPHPDADLRATLRRALIGEDVIECRSSYKGGPGPRDDPGRGRPRIFAYSGAFPDVAGLDDFLAAAARRGQVVKRCGTAPPTASLQAAGGHHIGRESRAEFLADLISADCVITYFGMTLLEAWYLETVPVLYETTSPVHEELGDYLAGAAGIQRLRWSDTSPVENEHRLERLAADDWPLPPGGPGGNGYDLLIEEIDRLSL